LISPDRLNAACAVASSTAVAAVVANGVFIMMSSRSASNFDRASERLDRFFKAGYAFPRRDSKGAGNPFAEA
jgi:hypothetical protein